MSLLRVEAGFHPPRKLASTPIEAGFHPNCRLLLPPSASTYPKSISLLTAAEQVRGDTLRSFERPVFVMKHGLPCSLYPWMIEAVKRSVTFSSSISHMCSGILMYWRAISAPSC